MECYRRLVRYPHPTPINPPKIINQAELIPNLRIAIALITANPMVRKSTNADWERVIVTETIKPSDAAFKPSKKPLVHGDCLSLGTHGLTSHTKINAGRKIPVVAATAPGCPANK